MKQMVLTRIDGMEMREVATPRIKKDTDVLIRIGAVGVCGSDIHYYTTGRIGEMVVQHPFAVGHECSGTVTEVGRAVRRVKPGDRVAVDPAMWCGECDQCRAGRRHTCRKLVFLGCPGQIEGCLGEYLVMPEPSCFPVDARTTSLEAAAFSEPLSIGVWAAKLAGNLRGKAVGILGFGPIGASCLLASVPHRPRRILVSDRIEPRLAMARTLGAWAGNFDTTDVIKGIFAEEPGKLDVVFECCGQQAALDQAVDLLKPGGKLVFVGIPEVDRVSFNPEKIRRSELCIQNVRRQNESVQDALDLIAGGGVDLGLLITHRFPFDRTKEAFDLVKSYRDGVMKAMIMF